MREINQKELDVITSKARADKAISTLKGILVGINSDNEVNDDEIDELHKWAINHKNLINRNPFKEFMTIIEETAKNNIPATETIEDLFWLCQKYENDNYYYNAVTAELQTLQGICHGILADGVIDDDEVFSLKEWLEQNTHLNTYYPYDEIRSLILSIVKDEIIDDDEKLVLKAYFNQFINLENEQISKRIKSETIDVNISGLCANNPDIVVDGKTFCITGKLKSGSRPNLEKIISDFGGLYSKNPTKKTDYLIVGDNGNKAWAYACYGRKVEQAIKMRKKGHTITLIHESDFIDFMDQFK